MLIVFSMNTQREKELLDRIAALEARVESLLSRISDIEKDFEAKLQKKDLEIERLRKIAFGSKSEKRSVGLKPKTKSETISPKGKNPLPDTFDEELIEVFPKETECPKCGTPLETIGYDDTEVLEVIPERTIRKRVRRYKKKCRVCGNNKIYQSKLDPEHQPLSKSRVGLSFLCSLVVKKFRYHLPLYRLEQIYNQIGIISRQRLSDWFLEASRILEPISRNIHKSLISESYLQGDETFVKVRNPKDNKIRIGYLWCLRHVSGKVYFDYSPSRSSEVASRLYDNFSGYLQSDALASYNDLFLNSDRHRIACMAHIRRKLLEGKIESSEDGKEIMQLISTLYFKEDCWSEDELDVIQKYREEEALPLLDEIFSKLKVLQLGLMPQSQLYKAIEYALNQEVPMKRYVELGIAKLDNNPIEREMKPIAVGKKNYLFFGSNAGGKAAAIFYSIIGTCRNLKVDTEHYLRTVIVELRRNPDQDLDLLMPWSQRFLPIS